MNKMDKKIINQNTIASLSNVAICSIVRDCGNKVKRNIPTIEKLRANFKSSVVIIFENDSKDNTKQILKEWSERYPNIIIECNNFATKTIPDNTPNGANKYYSHSRISKMVEYRNHYLKKLEEINFNPDFVIIVDLDVSKIYLKGILQSFEIANQWDVICANGVSMSPKFEKRYHDAYALVELGKENTPQTEESIINNSFRWNFLKKGQPLIPVYSAYGGLSIYRYNVIKNLRYRMIVNDNKRVEVRCEHFSFCHDIREKGFNKVFINPELKIKYQSIDLDLIKKYIYSKF